MYKNLKKIIFTSLLAVSMIFATTSTTVVNAQTSEGGSDAVTREFDS